MRTRLIVSCCFAFIAAPAGAAQPPAEAPRGLSAHLSKFNVANKSFDDALRELALQSRSNLVIGFEPATGSEERAPLIRLAMENGTAADALALMCAADKRYVYSEARPGVVEVRAIQQASYDVTQKRPARQGRSSLQPACPSHKSVLFQAEARYFRSPSPA